MASCRVISGHGLEGSRKLRRHCSLCEVAYIAPSEIRPPHGGCAGLTEEAVPLSTEHCLFRPGRIAGTRARPDRLYKNGSPAWSSNSRASRT